MAKVVISYSRENDRIARNVARDIEAIGHAVWFDKELSGGQVWWDQILATIRDCDVFALILSPESLNSAACRREYSYAADLGKPILPVMVSEGVSINLLPPALSKLQYIDYLKQDRDAALGLARALTSVPPPPPTTRSAAHAPGGSSLLSRKSHRADRDCKGPEYGGAECLGARSKKESA